MKISIEFILHDKHTGRAWTWHRLTGMDTTGRKVMPTLYTVKFAKLLKDNPDSNSIAKSTRDYMIVINRASHFKHSGCLCWIAKDLCQAH